MPHMLLLESLAQAAGVLCHYSGMMSRIGKTIFFFAAFDKCRFGRDVVPGDQLLLECTMKRAARGVAKIHGRASVDGEMVVESDLTAVIRDMADEATKRTRPHRMRAAADPGQLADQRRPSDAPGRTGSMPPRAPLMRR